MKSLFIAECYAEKYMLETLGNSTQPQKSKGISNAFEILNKFGDSKRNITALVDNSKLLSNFIKPYKQIDSINNILIFTHKDNRNKQVFYLELGAERTLLHDSDIAKVPLSKYDIPEDVKEFHKMNAKLHKGGTHQANFINLLKALASDSNTIMSHLKTLIQERI